MKKQALFIWIPKVAGSSIYHAISKSNFKRLKRPEEYKKFRNQGFVTFAHVDINFLIKKKYVSKDFFENSYKFCFVRNPWDRLVSVYHYQKYDQIMDFRHFVFFLDKKFKLNKTLLGDIFQVLYNGPRLVGKAINKSQRYLYPYLTYPMPKIGSFNVVGLSQANPQLSWITNEKGQIFVDFIGHFETLQKDVNKLFKILGIKEKLPHKNKSNRKKYKDYYDNQTKKIVEQIYQSDIKQFGYKF